MNHPYAVIVAKTQVVEIQILQSFSMEEIRVLCDGVRSLELMNKSLELMNTRVIVRYYNETKRADQKKILHRSVLP